MARRPAWQDRVMLDYLHKRLCALLLMLLGAAMPAAAAPVNVYNTYLYPPFHNADGSGMAADLVALLDRRLGGGQLKLVHLPRRRLLSLMDDQERPFDGMAVFLNPAFVGAQRAARVDWSEALF